MESRGNRTAGQQLAAKRAASGWSQRRMALYLGCSKAMVTQMETGAACPGRTLANRIGELIGIPTTAWDDPADLLPQDGSADAAA